MAAEDAERQAVKRAIEQRRYLEQLSDRADLEVLAGEAMWQ